MGTWAYQQSVSRQRTSGTGSGVLSNATTAGPPRRRNRVSQPPSPDGTDTGAAVAQNASVPGVPDSPNAAKGLCVPSASGIRSTGRIGVSL